MRHFVFVAHPQTVSLLGFLTFVCYDRFQRRFCLFLCDRCWWAQHLLRLGHCCLSFLLLLDIQATILVLFCDSRYYAFFRSLLFVRLFRLCCAHQRGYGRSPFYELVAPDSSSTLTYFGVGTVMLSTSPLGLQVLRCACCVHPSYRRGWRAGTDPPLHTSRVPYGLHAVFSTAFFARHGVASAVAVQPGIYVNGVCFQVLEISIG